MGEIARRREVRASKKALRRAVKDEHRCAAKAAADACQFGVAAQILGAANIDRCSVCVEARGVHSLRWEGTPVSICAGCLRSYFDRHYNSTTGKYTYEFHEEWFRAGAPQMHLRAYSKTDADATARALAELHGDKP
jgi:hypothetical protein